MIKRRPFSGIRSGLNMQFGSALDVQHVSHARVGFILLENFSLLSFTQAMDALVTANLICKNAFSTKIFTLGGDSVMSDLELPIHPTEKLSSVHLCNLNLLLICGGFRTQLVSNHQLRDVLAMVSQHDIALGGLWNGMWFIGEAGLLNGYKCAVHPEHKAALTETAKYSLVTSESYVVDRGRLSAASPVGAYYLMLEWIGTLHGRTLVDRVGEILAFEESRFRRLSPSAHQKVSEPLREIISLMDANIEEPLELDQIAAYVGISRRHIERLFKCQLCTSPTRYYIELRIIESRRLLQHSDLPIVEVAVACGFVSPSHFSRCFTAYFGYSPSKETRHGLVRSVKKKAS
ncbi:GlxA family transcriptional regulator [Pseudomonas eucalypticola]|uniref:GlxA family transcriptional regulator n=1 Tax=Pseudomonas eucalypticola TaxID=2599595 RepID=A0A7D5D6X0_9PSED|nr:GlxA family transcriptional regulator [Pseudomonas eucalypticola]QKZ04216.1 GlxA family transcriptional regulator [Pseudomonas eucalypticola]